MSKGKILFIATTDEDINMLIQLLLTRFAYNLIYYDYPPQTGKRFNEIEAICRQSKPDVIILANDDFSSPLNQKFCRELRDSPDLDGIGIILVFKRGGYLRLLKPDCDVDEYIRLPFPSEELDRQLQRLIN